MNPLLLRQLARQRPRFSLRAMLLAIVVVSVGLMYYRQWRIEHSPIDWQEFSPGKVQRGTGRGNIAFVWIYAPWCQPCVAYQDQVLEQPRVRRLIHEQRIIPVLLNIDNDPAEARALGITHLPHLAIYLPGERKPSRLIDKMPTEDELLDELNRALSEAQLITP